MRCPTEFAELLTPRGRRVLEGREPTLSGILKTGTRFITARGLIDPRPARAVLTALETLRPHLTEMAAPIPPESIWHQQRDYDDLLPKTVRVQTIELAPSKSKAAAQARALGITALVQSDSYRRFAEVLSGRKVKRKSGAQALCYQPGDYAGPHHDHHPEDPDARDGYTDVHLTFCTDAVDEQLMIYERGGHFSEQASVAGLGVVTAYRLPFWHYATPLTAKKRRAADARRWVLLGTFLDQR